MATSVRLLGDPYRLAETIRKILQGKAETIIEEESARAALAVKSRLEAEAIEVAIKVSQMISEDPSHPAYSLEMIIHNKQKHE